MSDEDSPMYHLAVVQMEFTRIATQIALLQLHRSQGFAVDEHELNLLYLQRRQLGDQCAELIRATLNN